LLSSSNRILTFAAIFLLALLAERLWPLRAITQKKTPRVLRNLSVAAIGAIALRLTTFGFVAAFASRAYMDHPSGIGSGHHWIIALLALDYTLYFWHRMNHRVRFLWRFHAVHHVDLDMDVSTATRFHFFELILSSGYRLLQILILGVSPVQWLLFEALVVTAAQFHHSNVRLPRRLEIALNWIIVTPRMHGLHHSQILSETDSNWSTIFSFWDRLHRSLSDFRRKENVTIGVPSYSNSAELTLAKVLIQPFQRQKPWELSA
jgi:sterol desaturase/sphingolipid hydroxylase (fatty acid hydroxylase superfamily)